MHKTYDVVVIGAGINGCGIARELAGRGRRVLVLDKGAIGGGASSRSSRLIHGGLRYLERFQFGLVYEALHDRQELLEAYPDLVRLRPFYLPTYRTSPRSTWKVWAGVTLYDLLAGRRCSGRSGRVPKAAFARQFPALKREGLRSVFRFWDGQTHDWELTRRVAGEARGLGAEILEHTALTGFAWGEEEIVLKTGAGPFRTRTVVNATGPWIDEVVDRFELPARFRIRKVSGIHLFLDGVLTAEPMFMQTREKRIFFIIPEPENGQTLIGTTEREESAPVDAVEVQEADVAYLLDEVNAYLVPEAQIRREDVREVSLGIRPLVAKRTAPTDLSREYALDLHQREKTQLLHVFGGKLTTYLSLARRTAKLLRISDFGFKSIQSAI